MKSITCQQRLLSLLVLTLWLSSNCNAWKRRLFRRHRGSEAAAAEEVSSPESLSPLPLFEAPFSAQQRSHFDRNLKKSIKNKLPPVLEQWWQQVYNNLHDVIFYKPPVGIVALFATLRLVYTGRILSIYAKAPVDQQRIAGVTTKRLGKFRKLRLDSDDSSYDSRGGVERVRRKLCCAALTAVCNDGKQTTLEDNDDKMELARAALNAVQVTYPPGGQRHVFLHEMAAPLSRLEQVLSKPKTRVKPKGNSFKKSKNIGSTLPDDEVQLLVQMSAKVAEIRALDALLRTCRDQLLKSSSRLQRLTAYWRRRVRLLQARNGLLAYFFKDAMEAHRMRLAFARGAYHQELQRLGTVQRIIMTRPVELGEEDLFRALQMSARGNQPSGANPDVSNGDGDSNNNGASTAQQHWNPLRSISRYAIRWNKGRLTFRVYDDDSTITSEAAFQTLMDQPNMPPSQWIEAAHSWTSSARRALADIINESFESFSRVASGTEKQMLMDVMNWCNYAEVAEEKESGFLLQQQWLTILQLLGSLSEGRRVGEGRVVGISESSLRAWSERIDIFGIPSSLAAVGIARMIHHYFAPRWAGIQETITSAHSIAWGIIHRRFWVPLSGIVQDLLNKRPSMLERFDQENEEMSLDILLRDLGLGDGNPENRKDALQQASRQYESDLKSGMFRNVVKGRLIRLLLIQVQQLKVGLLHAMEGVDILVDNNQLNFQIMAAIPAVLFVTFGTRFFFRFLYSFRLKDLRPLRDVHSEMAQYLDNAEKVLLLAGTSNGSRVHSGERMADMSSTVGLVTTMSVLQPSELGEIVMCMHLYLVLLEFCCPPFPSRSCDTIHKSIQEMLAVQGTLNQLGTEQQAYMLQLIKQKHMDLLKYL